MSLDHLLSQPLSPVRDDGFSARIVLRLARRRQRWKNLAWSLATALALGLVWLLPLDQANAMIAVWLPKLASSQILAYTAGGFVLLWAWRPRVFRL